MYASSDCPSCGQPWPQNDADSPASLEKLRELRRLRDEYTTKRRILDAATVVAFGERTVKAISEITDVG
jgi:hypothetical protein